MATRRRFLTTLAGGLALPSLESFGQSAANGAKVAPTRLAYVYSPNGVNVDQWYPTESGAGYSMPTSLKPLEHHRENFQILRNLDLEAAESQGDGAGDHARANASFLTGVHPKKTAGADISLGISADQLAADAVSGQTRVSSLELSTDAARRAGKCDSGYSCAYQYNLAWRSETTPVPPERDPRLVFERLFGTGDTEKDAERLHLKKSILDLALDDAKALQRKASGADRVKMDEYFNAVREVEQRIERAEKFRVATPEIDKPNGVPRDYEEHIRAMFELMALAFQTDTTRVSTFMLAHDGSNRSFGEIGVSEGHHNLSHHGLKAEKLVNIQKIDEFYARQFAWFLDKLSELKDGEQSLLENSMIVYGSGIKDGNRHSHRDVPVLLAGHGAGLKPGAHKTFADNTPLSNLHLSLARRMGSNAERVGDSTGLLSRI